MRKVTKPRLLALLLFVCAIGSWFLKDPNYWLWNSFYDNYPKITKHVIHPWEEIHEMEAVSLIREIERERQALGASKLPAEEIIKASFALESRLFKIQLRTISKEEDRGLTYEFDEAPAPIFSEMQNLEIRIMNFRDRFTSPENRQLIEKLSLEDSKKVKIEWEQGFRAEVIGTWRYRITRSLLLTLLALVVLVIERGLSTGWTFERLVGRRTIRFATMLAGFTFATIGGGPAIAQQLLFKISRADQQQEKALELEAPDPLASGEGGNPVKKPTAVPSTLTVWLFGDATGTASHDRQLIFVFTAGRDTPFPGFTVLQQSRQTSDAATATGNTTFGWSHRFGKSFDLTGTAGPAFNYDTRGNLGGFNHQIITLIISNWRTRYFQFSSLVKLMAPTDPKVRFADRHIQTIRGPTKGTPRFLQGLALQMENWHINGPGGGHWVEFMVGPIVNIGDTIGKPESAWSWFSVYPYTDLCRPQPSHNRLWDVRVQFKRTFSLAHAR
jgi:hypothetical protein